MTATEPLALPDVPVEVIDFATRHGTAHNIASVLAAARDAFPDAPLRTYLEADPELDGEWRIIVHVEIGAWAAQQECDAADAFHAEILRRVPPHEYIGAFCLRLREAP